MKRRGQLLRDERGASIIEIGVSLVITSIMAVAMVNWMSTAGAAAVLHSNDDAVVQDLRLAKERITRELRVAQSVSVATPDQVTVWVDHDGDGFADVGETITWVISTDGTLSRWTDAGDQQVQVSGLVYADSGFGYDDPDAAEVTSIWIGLVATLPPRESGAEPGQRSISTQVHLRNG